MVCRKSLNINSQAYIDLTSLIYGKPCFLREFDKELIKLSILKDFILITFE